MLHHLRAGRLPDAEVVAYPANLFRSQSDAIPARVVQWRLHKAGSFIASGGRSSVLLFGYSAARGGRTSLAPGQRVERLRSYCGG
jgi:hypothetical protein